MGLEAKTVSRAEACARRGKDWRQVFRQIAAEQAYADELGIDLTPADAAPAADPVDQPQGADA